MPIKRRNAKARAHRVTPDAIEAYVAGDYMRLHRALGLKPYQMSPLPLSVEPLGCDPDEPPTGRPGTGWEASWPLACELQADLIKAAGQVPEA